MRNIEKALLTDYSGKWDVNGLDGERLAKRLQAIAEIGQTAEGGSRRIGFSQEEQAAKELVMDWMEALGMEVKQDGAMNVFGWINGENPNLPAIVTGSHLDTVPNGGHIDGVLGVLAPVEILESLHAEGRKPERTIVIAIFTNEEGACFNSGFTGSQAITKAYTDETLAKLQHGDERFSDVLKRNGSSIETYKQASLPVDEASLFVEVHIEQGTQLEKINQACGIVSGIAGPLWLEVTFTGRTDHAGNTPMNDRQDALAAAGDFIRRIPAIPAKHSDSAVATVGKIDVHPNGINVIAGEVTCYVDIRDIYEEKRAAVLKDIIAQLQVINETHHVQSTWRESANTAPVLIEKEWIDQWKSIFHDHGLEPIKIVSGAGHDAMIMAHMMPVTMLFVRSKDGISHHPAEWTSLGDAMEAIYLLKKYIQAY